MKSVLKWDIFSIRDISDDRKLVVMILIVGLGQGHRGYRDRFSSGLCFIPLSYWTNFTLEDPRTPQSVLFSLQTTT